MKIIHVTGASGAGKTLFIEDLISGLKQRGVVGVVKHLGHHTYRLEDEKDTTRFFERGAEISVGTDDEKSVIAVRGAGLDEVLRILSDAGTEFGVIEGFKTRGFPKIVIGDLEADNCVLKNPSVAEVLSSLDLFEDYFSVEGLVRDLKRDCDVSRAGAILTFNGIVREWTGDEKTEYLDFDDRIDEKLREIKEGMEAVPGILGVRFHHHKGRLYAGEDITYLAVIAEHRHEAFQAISSAIDRLKQEIHNLP